MVLLCKDSLVTKFTIYQKYHNNKNLTSNNNNNNSPTSGLSMEFGCVVELHGCSVYMCWANGFLYCMYVVSVSC